MCKCESQVVVVPVTIFLEFVSFSTVYACVRMCLQMRDSLGAGWVGTTAEQHARDLQMTAGGIMQRGIVFAENNSCVNIC